MKPSKLVSAARPREGRPQPGRQRRNCLEVAVLCSPAQAVQHMADQVIAERGLRHGQFVFLPLDPA